MTVKLVQAGLRYKPEVLEMLSQIPKEDSAFLRGYGRISKVTIVGFLQRLYNAALGWHLEEGMVPTTTYWVYDDKKLAQLYQAADIFLMPSEQEAFGLMAIEAMSSKVPVISIKGTSLESVTNAPECGICCEKEDFSNELNRLINNADEIKLRAEKSYQYAKENYDKEVYIKRMIEIYQDIIKNHKIEPEWQDVLGQMEKYNINNYYVDNKIAIAKNPIWKLIYRLLIRPFLKKKYDKKTLKTRFDRKYL